MEDAIQRCRALLIAQWQRLVLRSFRFLPKIHASDQFLEARFGSQAVEKFARDNGLVDTFERAGAIVLNPGCGACIGCGPGVSDTGDQVTISAINRNYKGRSGPGKLWLASPLSVAASAFTGRITAYRPGMFSEVSSLAAR